MRHYVIPRRKNRGIGVSSCFKGGSSTALNSKQAVAMGQAVAMVTLLETEMLHQVEETGERREINSCYVALSEEINFILGINSALGSHLLGSEDT
jgi:hypothetical protein